MRWKFSNKKRESGSRSIADQYITLARVFKTQGRFGEVAAELHSDIPNRIIPGMRLWALGENGDRREVRIQEIWPHKGGLVLKFEGVDSISDAELFLSCELQVPQAERAELDAGWTYVSDLVGCTVFDGTRQVGVVEQVQFGAGEAPLLIVKGDGERHEIPYAELYLKRVDIVSRAISMELPDGLLELNASPTTEEKQEQVLGRKRKPDPQSGRGDAQK